MLNQEEIKEDPQRIIKSKPFIDKYNWEGISYPSEKDEWKKFEKSNLTIALVVYMLKKYILPMFQNTIQMVKNNLFFWWFQTDKDGIIFQ